MDQYFDRVGRFQLLLLIVAEFDLVAKLETILPSKCDHVNDL